MEKKKKGKSSSVSVFYLIDRGVGFSLWKKGKGGRRETRERLVHTAFLVSTSLRFLPCVKKKRKKEREKGKERREEGALCSRDEGGRRVVCISLDLRRGEKRGGKEQTDFAAPELISFFIERGRKKEKGGKGGGRKGGKKRKGGDKGHDWNTSRGEVIRILRSRGKRGGGEGGGEGGEGGGERREGHG